MDINIFTAAMRREFLTSYAKPVTPLPFERFTTTLSSTARIENFPWMSPTPQMTRYEGYRKVAQTAERKYSVENFEYDAAFEVRLRDVEDDKVGGYEMKARDMAYKAKYKTKADLVVKTLASGASTLCFDDSNFFATSHNLGGAGTVATGFGGGGNSITYTPTVAAATAQADDATTNKFIVLIHKPDAVLNPMVFLNRKEPKFMTDGGTPGSSWDKRVKYWIDGEFGVGFGYWWDAVLCTITNTPNLTGLFNAIDACRQQLRSMYLPQALPTDPFEYPHEQVMFDAGNATILCSTKLEQMFTHVLNEDRVGVSIPGSNGGITSNIYYKSFGLLTTNYLN